jgi:hypothetical protein
VGSVEKAVNSNQQSANQKSETHLANHDLEARIVVKRVYECVAALSDARQSRSRGSANLADFDGV